MSINGIELWQGELTLDEATYQCCWRWLDADEQAHAERLTNPLARQRYVEVHGRLRGVLSRYLGQPPERIRIKKAEHGKPYLADYPELAFNLSHAGNNLALAIANDCRLGVDIELCKPRTNLAQLVAKCFAASEEEYWRQLPDMQKTSAFYRFWTSKEAFVKATGRGIALGLKQCVLDVNKPGLFLSLPEGYGRADAWRVWDFEPPLGQSLRGAIVADTAIANVKLFDFGAGGELASACKRQVFSDSQRK